ncbi:MAG: flagellar protein FlgN [Opitutales bacterium]|nr:flagellar protein FlgN [Opitutales bacterium]
MTNKKHEPLVDLLRDEIEAYGKLFHLLEEQRSALINQDVDAILLLNKEIDEHSVQINRFNNERKKMVSELHPTGSTRIIPFINEIDDASKGLFEELVQEINRLIRESQRQLSCNQMLYRRALDVSRDTLRILRPDNSNVPGIYRRDGNTNNLRRNIAAAYVARTA